MSSILKKVFADIDRKDLLKVAILSLIFFLLIGSYTVTRELKDSIFANIVGAERKYQGYAKMLSMIVLIPLIMLHSIIVDKMKRHYLLYIYPVLFSLSGFIFVFLFGFKNIGLNNTVTSPYRIIGWLFYFFIEAFSPLLVGVFWAFVNSITKPGAAKNNYVVMIAASKLGGIVMAGSAWLFFRADPYSANMNIQLVLATSSLALLLVPIAVYYLVSHVPSSDLHGYEAAYKFEKKEAREHIAENRSWYTGMTSGLTLLFRYPYVLGIFSMSFFFEFINQIIKVENIIFGKDSTNTIAQFTGFLLWQAILVHIVGFLVVVFGTKAIIQALGERKSLILIPTLTGLSSIGFIFWRSRFTAILAFVVTRSVHYAFSAPLKESLYIPTIKEIKFKSKSWIDGVGNKFAKTLAATFYNMSANGLIGTALIKIQATYFSITILVWLASAYALGRKYENTVKNNEVIGSDSKI